MTIAVSGELRGPSTRDGFDVVERKGIGHPDSLADIIAEEFSRRYSLLGMERFGAVPNHWVDKVALIGAGSVIDFGCYSIEKPVSAYLFGKVTRSVGDERIPIEDLFRDVVEDVLRRATRDSRILGHLRTHVENTAGVAADHPPFFYYPGGASDCSGLTQAAWAAAGVSIPRVTTDQVRIGTPVALDELQPGDLLFYDTGSGPSPSHVTMYVGDGQMVNAPSTGQTIRVEPVQSGYYSPRFTAARRPV